MRRILVSAFIGALWIGFSGVFFFNVDEGKPNRLIQDNASDFYFMSESESDLEVTIGELCRDFSGYQFSQMPFNSFLRNLRKKDGGSVEPLVEQLKTVSDVHFFEKELPGRTKEYIMVGRLGKECLTIVFRATET